MSIQQKEQSFHIEKSISVGHILTTIALIVGGLMYLSDQDKRIEANAATIEFFKAQRVEDISRAESQRAEDNKRIEKQLDNINQKLDRLINQGGS